MINFLYITFLKNNIIVTLVKKILKDNKIYLKTLKTINSGICGFKNKQKKTPFACIFILKQFFINNPINIIFKGESFFKNLILQFFKKKNIKILSIKEKTINPYNGCKYSKKKILHEYKI